MIRAVRSSLAKGYKHYSVQGKPLNTDLEVVKALRDDGEILIKSPAGENYSDYESLEMGQVSKVRVH